MAKKEVLMGTPAGARHREVCYLVPKGTTKFIDFACDFSHLNRKFMRQGNVFALRVEILQMDDADMTNDHSLAIWAMPNTWQIRKAWHLGFKAWRKQTAQVIQEHGIKPGRWSDFKIQYNPAHAAAGRLYPSSPVAGGGSGMSYITSGRDWSYSKVVDQDSEQDYTFTMFAHGGALATSNAFSLWTAYDTLADQVPEDPQTTNASPFHTILFDVGDNAGNLAIADNIENDNDNPPYPNINLWTQEQFYRISQNGFHPQSTGFMEVPCGLLQLTNNAAAGDIAIKVTAAAGPNEGILAERM